MKTTYFFTIVTLIGIALTSNAQVDNTFHGDNAGANSRGNFNTGIGKKALVDNTGNSNVGLGMKALGFSSGGFNCAVGNESMALNGIGTLNVAFGTRSLLNNISGSRNVAIGHRTSEANIEGNDNTAIGYSSLLFNIGSNNVALGASTPRNLLTGDSNIFVGTQTAIYLLHGSNNVVLGNNVAFDKNPSTPFLAGSDTNRSIVIADGAGTQRIFVSKTGSTGLGLGNNVIPNNRLDVKGGVAIGKAYTPDAYSQGETAPLNGLLVEGRVGIGTPSPNSKLEINSGGAGASGLRFTNLNSNSVIPTQTVNKFLTVNAVGDVILQKMSNNAVETNTLTSAANVMTSNVNGIVSSANTVNSISNLINTSNQLITTVNGVASTPVTLPAPTFEENDGSTTNELQTISQVGNTITLSHNGGSFVLPTFTDTDSQSLALTGNVLSISNGNSVTLPAQVPQTISQTGNTVTLSNGGGSFVLPTFTDTDSQSLALTGNILSISNGNNVTLPTQTLSQAGNTVTLSNGGGSFNLPTFTDTDGQSLSLNGNVLSISNGNNVTLPTYTQTLSQTGNTITLSNGGGSFNLPTFTQTPQTITQTGNTITLSNGGGSFNLPTTSVVAGTNVTVTGNGSTGTPYRVSSTDTSLYADNGSINQATTVNGNRVVNMNNRNIWFNGSGSESNGKIYIGSTATYPSTTGNYKLFVEGGILTEKVKVALRSTANWADYVFEKDYNLMPLKEVEEFISENKHLPGIDSAEDLAKGGLDLAEMQAKHMQKIEELTLYIIEQNKKIEKNTQDIIELKQQIKSLTANED